jgi:ribosome-binding factor A
MKRGYQRTDRVADLIQKALAQIIQYDMSDSRFAMVTITSVEPSRDLSYAKVYVSVLEDDEAKLKETVKALNRSAKAFRYELAQAVKLRIAPELKFVFDASTLHGFKLSQLIDEAVKKEKK